MTQHFTAGRDHADVADGDLRAVRFGVTPAINALATMMLGVTVVLIIATGIVLPARVEERARGGPREGSRRRAGPGLGAGPSGQTRSSDRGKQLGQTRRSDPRIEAGGQGP